MNLKKLNLIADVYFGLILGTGLVYTGLLLVGAQKILPAAAMQLIFLLDEIKFKENIVNLIVSQEFLINVLPGILVIILIVKYGEAIIKSIKNYQETVRMLKQWRVKETKEPMIFTAGMLRPQIYISKGILEKHTQQEIRAMIEHEKNHKRNFHPAKVFIINLIKLLLPINSFSEYYLALIEISSDKAAEEKLKTKKPIVSALLKFGETNISAGISYFNSQSERIKILVGQKSQSWKLPMVAYLVIVGLLTIGTINLKETNIFHNCEHLVKCMDLLIKSSNPILNH